RKIGIDQTARLILENFLGYCILITRTHPGAVVHAHRCIAPERPGLRGRGERELQSRCPRRDPPVPLSEPALPMWNGQMRQVRQPHPARCRTPARPELEGKEAARRKAW